MNAQLRPAQDRSRQSSPGLALLALLLGLTLSACRAAPSRAPGPVAPPQAETPGPGEDDWTLSASAYLWIAQKRGVIEAPNVAIPLDDPDESSGAFLYFEGERGPWGFVADLDLISSKDEAAGPGGPIVVEEDTLIGELDATFRPAGSESLQFLAGIRVLDSSQDILFPVAQDIAVDTTLVDPVLGAQGTWPLNDSIGFRLRADIGGFGLDSDFTYQAFGLFAWEFAQHWHATAGYRILGWEFEEDGIRNDLRLSGVLFGVAARF